MDNFLNKTFKLLFLQCIFVCNIYAHNEIDKEGGFVALVPYGSSVDQDGWALGTQYNGALSNQYVWATATNYVATGGAGYLILDNNNANDVTTIYLGNNITIGDGAPQDPIITAENSFSGDLIIKTRGNIRLQNDYNNQEIININNARNVTIEGGTYDKTRKTANAVDSYAVRIASVDNLIDISNATFLGPDVDQNWVQDGGGVGLQLENANNVILNNVTSVGGIGKQAQYNNTDDAQDTGNSTSYDDLFGGSGMLISGGSPTIMATNLTATAGEAGNRFVNFQRVTNNVINTAVSGGHGLLISGSPQALNIFNGQFTGKDAGNTSIDAEDGRTFSVDLSSSGGSGINGNIGNGTLTNINATAGNAGNLTLNLQIDGGVEFTGNGGFGFRGSSSSGNISGNFVGGNGSSDYRILSNGSTNTVIGGHGVQNDGGLININKGLYIGGNGGTNNYISSSDETSSTSINAHGGVGAFGPMHIKTGLFEGGNGGQIVAETAHAATAFAYGGDGVTINTGDESSSSFISIIEDGIFRGGNGGNITLTNGSVNTRGGRGLTSNLLDDDGDSIFTNPAGAGTVTTNIGTLIINGGTFEGGNGGRSVTQNGSAAAWGGFGASLAGGTNLIYGGSFVAGNAGEAKSNVAESSGENIALLITNTVTTSIDGDVEIFGNLQIHDAQNLNLEKGILTDNVFLLGQISNMTMSSSFAVPEDKNLEIIQNSFITNTSVNINLNSLSDGSVFKNISLIGGSELTFSNLQFQSANNSLIRLFNDSELTFNNGAKLSSNSKILVGYGDLTSSGDLILDEGSSIDVYYNGSDAGQVNINSGDINFLSSSAAINFIGRPLLPNGSVSFGRFGDNANALDQSKINIDFGWLTDTTLNTQDNGVNDELVITHSFAIPNNFISSNKFSSANHYTDTTNYLSNINNFNIFNDMGSSIGSEIIKFSELNEIDTSNGIMKDQYQFHNLISARNTEVRSRHGYASSKYSNNLPDGVSGPTSKEHSQGWVRSYNVRGKYDATSIFSSHKLDGHGTIIGLDKYFNDMLIGVAAGNSKSKSHSDSVYSSDTEILSGSLYSTIGGRKKYIDLAISYGEAETDVSDAINMTSYNVNSSSESYFIGSGYSFISNEGLQLTPEISFLYSKYNQDSYVRSGITPKKINAFSSTSKLLTTGINLASKYQIDWFNLGLAMIPEFRMHWLHEINSNESNTINYTFMNNGNSGSLNIRPKDENLFKVGVGLNIWSWFSKNTRLELDYDLTTSDSYKEHLVSAKIGIKF